FDDFREMQASREVRESFDAGFTTLHELLHGLGYKDPTSFKELGECEEALNQARAELALPLRDQYFGDELQMARQFVAVRLRYRNYKTRASTGSTRARIQYLFFMVNTNPGQCVAPAGVAVFDCGNGVAYRRKESKDQKGKGLKGD